jgi:DNA topoisomerase-3
MADVPQVVKALMTSSDEGIRSKSKEITTPNIRKSVFNNKGMQNEEHHAIIPTVLPLPLGIVGDELTLYRMVCVRYLMSLSPDYEHDETIAETAINGLPFKAKGSIPRVIGWKQFANEKNPTERLLPPLVDGEKVRVVNSRISEGKTTPPPYFTEGAFVDEEMGGIAKYVSDPKIKSILKEKSGIGTAATRADTVETLKRRGYAWVNADGLLMDTKMGRKLINVLPLKLTAPDMTAKWEIELKQVSQGTLTPFEFIDGVKLFVKGGVKWFESQKGLISIEADKSENVGDKKAASSKKPRAASTTARKPRAASTTPRKPREKKV